MSYTAADIIARRKHLWADGHDIRQDTQYVRAVAEKIVEDEALRAEIRAYPPLLIEMCMQIVDKTKETVPFFLNDVQREIDKALREGGAGRYYTLKGRQQGVTSYVTARQVAYTITTPNFSGFTVADSPDNVRVIFNDKGKTVYGRLPERLKPTEKYNSRTELYFEKLCASWRIAAAGDETGRSRTLSFLHMSEIAFFRVELSALERSIGETLTPDATVVYETTANGFNQAKDLWDGGTCVNLFFPWWKTAEYTAAHAEYSKADAWLRKRIEWLQAQGLTEGQINWYVNKYNSYLEKDSIKQEYPCFPEEAFLSSGRCRFNAEILYARLNALKGSKPLKIGYFAYDYDGLKITGIKWVDDAQGFIAIYRDVEYGHPYVIGGDTAGEGSDKFIGQVLDNSTAEQVAVLSKEVGEEIYARQMYCLGRYYNDALLGIEINFSTYPVKELERLAYPRQYMRDKEDVIGVALDKKHGFKTTIITRPLIIAGLDVVISEAVGTITDAETLKECLTFVKDETGRAAADTGKHDDRVMALAIAHYIRPQQRYTVIEPPQEKTRPQIVRTKSGKFYVK